MDTSSIPGLELMQIADVVAREKSIEREEVIMAMEEAIQKAGRSKYGNDRDIRAMIDRKTGSIQLERWTEVVDEVEDDSTQMSGAEGEKHGLPLAIFSASHCLPLNLAGLPRRQQSRLSLKKFAKLSVRANIRNIRTVLVRWFWVQSNALKVIQLPSILAVLKG